MRRRPPSSTRTDTHSPCTPLFRSCPAGLRGGRREGRPGRPGRQRAGLGEALAPALAGRSATPDLGGGPARRSPSLRGLAGADEARSEEHTSELQSLMRSSYAGFCLKKKTNLTEHSNPNLELI